MTEATVEALPTGAYNFFIGPVTNSLRRSTHLNVTEYREDAKLDPLVFASVADIQGLLRVLPSYITVHGAPAADPGTGGLNLRSSLSLSHPARRARCPTARRAGTHFTRPRPADKVK